MAIQILSDLHLEAPQGYDVFEIVPQAPNLALLGDVGNVAIHKDDYLAFLTQQLKQFRVVLYVPGNHEAYSSNWSDTIKILRQFEQDVSADDSLGQFVLLDRTIFHLANTNIAILGCSLFSSVPPENEAAVSNGLNDFFHIDDWDVNMHNSAHERDLAWLNSQVTELEHSDVRIMVLTHWSPSLDARTIDPRYAGSAITNAFSTDLSGNICFKSSKVRVWAFGHTHYNCDLILHRESDAEPLRLVTNQRGYYFAQAEGFDPQKVITI